MKDQLYKWYKVCVQCKQRNARPGLKRSTLESSRVGRPMERIAFDILSFPITTDGGVNVVHVVYDYFSKLVEPFPLPDHHKGPEFKGVSDRDILAIGN